MKKIALAVLAAGALPLAAYAGTDSAPQTRPAGATDHIRLGRLPLAVAAGAGAVWVSTAAPPTGVLLRISPRDRRVTARIRVGRTPVAIAIDQDVWVANGLGASTDPHAPGENTVTRIDPRTNRVVATIAIDDPESIAAGLGAIWVGRPGSGLGAIVRIDPSTNRATATTHVPADGPVQVATGFGSLWALTPRIRAGHPSRSTLYRIDTRTGRIVARTPIPGSSDELAIGEQGVWIGATGVLEVDPRTNQLIGPRIAVRGGNLAAGERSVWLVAGNGIVWRIDPRRRRLLGSPIRIGTSADEIATGIGAAWVTDTRDRTLVRIQP